MLTTKSGGSRPARALSCLPAFFVQAQPNHGGSSVKGGRPIADKCQTTETGGQAHGLDVT